MYVDIEHEIKKEKLIFEELYVYYIGLNWIGRLECDVRYASGGGKADECANERFINI